MATSIRQLWYGPFWPLGYIQPAYRGAGEALTQLITNAGLNIESSEYYEAAAMGIIVCPRRQQGGASAVTTGYIYLVAQYADGTFSSNNQGTTILAIPPGSGPVWVPEAQYGGSRFKLSELGIDVDVDGDGADVCAIMQ